MKQQHALEIIKAGYNVFLTGPAGSGKTHTLNETIQTLRAHGLTVGVTASTGIAATHLSGMTIHSWSGIGVRDQLTEWDIDALLQKEFLHKRYERTDVLIIDEVSMLHARQLAMVDYLAQAFRQDIRPFGGMQIILCGDFFQLPPISRNGAPREFVMESQLWHDLDLKICYLDEQFRQHDEALLKLLHEIRNNTVSPANTALLTERIGKDIVQTTIKPTRLYTHNTDVDRINAQELSQLQTESKTYAMTSKGKKGLVAVLKKSAPAIEKLQLKADAQVMFIKNDPAGKFVNGTRGRIAHFSDIGLPVVELHDGRHITAEPMDWSIDDAGKTLATIRQIPLKLAWAITVHKSQGMSLDAAEIDLSQAFEPGMGYVALSRVRSLDGLRLLGFNDTALKVDEKILAFDEKIQEQSAEVSESLQNLLAAPLRRLDTIQKNKSKKKIKNHHHTHALLEEGYTIEGAAKKLDWTMSTIINHIEKCIDEGMMIDFDDLLPDADANDEIRAVFEKQKNDALKPVYEYFDGRYEYHYLRLVRAWMRQKEK